MNDKASINLTGKDAAKLLEGLTKNPQLRSEDDPSILAEEQFPTDHHALLQGKTDGSSTDNIITILRWERQHTPHLAEEQKAMLTEQKNKTAKLFQFTATANNPWDEVQFNFWKHKVTNMVLSSIRLALNDDARSDVNKLLFATGDHNNVTVSSGDKRNISGLLICHPILLNSPFVEPAGIDLLLDDLLLERHPYTVAKANDNSGSYEADKAYSKIETLKAAALLALRSIYQVASHTFHVYLWDLLPGARDNGSHVFTQVKEGRNQYLVQAEAAGLKLRPHSAKDTLTFLHKHFVKENTDQFIIKWMLILRHTREPGINLYEWCNSFGPLIRTYLRTSSVDYLGKAELQRVNKCITSQITDFEQSILAQVSDKWKPITLADGAFDLDELKRDVSASDSKFAVRKYKPTALILEYLTARAARQQVPLPPFMTLKSSTAKKRRESPAHNDKHLKRFRKGKQRPLFLLDQDTEEDDEQYEQQDDEGDDEHNADGTGETEWDSLAFEQRKSFAPCTTPYCKERNIAHTHTTDRCYKLHPPKGKGSGSKGSSSLLFTKGKKGDAKGKGKSKGKGKGKPGKGKGDRKGKRPKGKDSRGLGRSSDDTCHFCKLPGHYKAECPKFAALSSKTSYGRIRAKLSNEKVYVYDLLEDSVDSEVCWNCLCQECDWTTCSPPVETLLFQDASKSFVEDGMWDMVSNAKSSNPPLSKEMFLQERGLADDHWEDDTDGDHENWGEDDESEEDN